MIGPPDRDALDVRMAKAMSHPVRVRLFQLLERGEASPSELARKLDLPLVNVSHHIKVLVKLDVIEQVAQRYVRGAIEHRYRITRLPWVMPSDMEELPTEGARGVFNRIAHLAVDDLRAAVGEDLTFARTKIHASYTLVELDEEGWERVYDTLFAALEGAIAEETASRERARAAGDDRPLSRGRMSLFFYEVPPAADEPS